MKKSGCKSTVTKKLIYLLDGANFAELWNVVDWRAFTSSCKSLTPMFHEVMQELWQPVKRYESTSLIV